MSDDLLVPDRSIVSLDDARNEKPKARGTGPSSDFVTRRDLVTIVTKINTGISDAALAVGQKVYDQVVEETQAHLEKMHFQIRQEIMAEIDARTLRGRARRQWLAVKDRVTPWLMELGLVSPVAETPDVRLVDAVEALDPNVQEYRPDIAEAYRISGAEENTAVLP